MAGIIADMVLFSWSCGYPVFPKLVILSFESAILISMSIRPAFYSATITENMSRIVCNHCQLPKQTKTVTFMFVELSMSRANYRDPSEVN